MPSFQAPMSKKLVFGVVLSSLLLAGAALAKTPNLASSGSVPPESPQARMHTWQDAFAAFTAKHSELSSEQAQAVRDLLGIGDETFFSDALSADQRALFVKRFDDLRKALPTPTYTDLAKRLSNLRGWLTSNEVTVDSPQPTDPPPCACLVGGSGCTTGFTCSAAGECTKPAGSTNNGVCVRNP